MIEIQVLGSMNGVVEDKEADALKKFKEALNDVLKPDYEDSHLLRFLRARRLNLENAEKMFRNHLKFRKRFNVDSTLQTYQMSELMAKHKRTQFLGFDKDGHAVRLYNFGKMDMKGYVRAITLQEFLEFFINIFEHELKMMREQNIKTGNTAETACYIIDSGGFNITQLITDKRSIRYLINLIRLYQDNFPERLHALHIVNAPSLFTVAFKLFAPFLDEVVLRKLKVYGEGYNWQKEVFSSIPKDIIPAYLGGSLEKPYGDPYCNEILNWIPKVPLSYYRTSAYCMDLNEEGVYIKDIKANSFFEVRKDILVPNMLLKWEFQINNHDVQFGLFLESRKNENEATIRETILPLERKDCDVLTEKSEHICKEAGIYIFRFDNTHSWFSSKQVIYKIEVEANVSL